MYDPDSAFRRDPLSSWLVWSSSKRLSTSRAALEASDQLSLVGKLLTTQKEPCSALPDPLRIPQVDQLDDFSIVVVFSDGTRDMYTAEELDGLKLKTAPTAE